MVLLLVLLLPNLGTLACGIGLGDGRSQSCTHSREPLLHCLRPCFLCAITAFCAVVQVEYGIARVEAALPRLCMLAQGGTGREAGNVVEQPAL